jgi:hypothetical protein
MIGGYHVHAMLTMGDWDFHQGSEQYGQLMSVADIIGFHYVRITEYGIECLKQIIADERADGRAPPPILSTK